MHPWCVPCFTHLRRSFFIYMVTDMKTTSILSGLLISDSRQYFSITECILIFVFLMHVIHVQASLICTNDVRHTCMSQSHQQMLTGVYKYYVIENKLLESAWEVEEWVPHVCCVFMTTHYTYSSDPILFIVVVRMR